ncbi:acyl-CoA dehydrogenase [Ornithinicoccus hortensis]|uniref:acyl-CoA oxidase n=1 Tax=Ornithinicoccus hortensis TaxID=82346 RepID=A0A542YPE2_9MICO|nr:acyl-CoA dehydrogenase [Ornithinicoccus hortensis]TQL49973.1 acyl-coenzyme A oxidase [Ornithinicoccus hortensis]
MSTTTTQHTPDVRTSQAPASTAPAEQVSDLGAALRHAIDGPRREIRETARRELDPAELLRDPGLSIPEARRWVRDRLQGLADRGYGGRGYPTTVGGQADLGGTVAEFEMLAHFDLSLVVKSGVHFGLFGGAVSSLGSDRHHQEFLPGVISLATPGCFAMTEIGHGSDVAALETTLTYDPETDEIVVHSPTENATKTYIGGAAEDAVLAVVFGQLVVGEENHGVHAAIVPVREDGRALPGITIGDNGVKGGLAGVDNGTLRFDQVRVPRSMLLDRYGGVTDDGTYASSIDSPNRRFFTMLGALVRGRICVGGASTVSARKALSIATRYAVQRRQFDAPGRDEEVLLLDYLAHQRKLLPAIATAYALTFAQNTLTERLAEVQEAPERDLAAQRELETRAAGLKAVSTAFANETIQLCREACGGAGYMAENGLTVLRQDADVFATFEGDNTVLLQLLAKGLLTNYKEMVGDLDMLGMVQFAVRSFGGSVIARTVANPLIERLIQAASRRSEDETLLDRGWHLTMFESRESHVLESLALRIQALAKETDDPFVAFNTTQDHVLLAARTHMDRVVLEAFVAAIDACEDEAARATLDRLCDLYVLSNLEADSGWFLRHQRMSAGRAKAVTRAINELCGQLREDVIPIVEGMGFPQSWLGSAMLR